MKKLNFFNIYTLLIINLMSIKLSAQETYNNCNQALQICPNVLTSVNNINANKTLCTDCEDDFAATLCFSSNNSIWLKFLTNDSGGDVQIDISNLVFLQKVKQSTIIQAALIQAAIPCDASTYKVIGSCENNKSNGFTLPANGLLPLTTYYLVINGNISVGDLYASEASMDILMNGTAVNREIPSITIDPIKTNLCKDEAVRINSILSNCKDSSTFRWYKNDTLFAVSDSSFIETARINDGDIIRVENECFSTCNVSVSSTSNPFSVFSFRISSGKDTTIIENTPYQLQGDADADSYYWIPYTYFESDKSLKPNISIATSTTFTLIASKNNCTQSDQVKINVKTKNLNPPNAFSPNGDNINDTWDIPFLEDFPNCEIKVFSRWGQPVFETTGYSFKKAWNGSYNGNTLDEGVYFYVINLRDSYVKEPLKGTVTIIR